MNGDEPNPLIALLTRALGGMVTDIREERLEATVHRERDRLHVVRDGDSQTLLLERFPVDRAREVSLLPFLGRKTDRVPVVYAKGEPHVMSARRWLLREDTSELPLACEGDPRQIVDVKIAIERAVAKDGPALGALGVPTRTPLDVIEDVALIAGEDALGQGRKAAMWLAKWPLTLCHGDLRCANAPVTARGVVLEAWGKAHLGCGLLDIVRLAADLGARGHAVLGAELPRRYAELAEVTMGSELLRAAELIDRLERKYLKV